MGNQVRKEKANIGNAEVQALLNLDSPAHRKRSDGSNKLTSVMNGSAVGI